MPFNNTIINVTGKKIAESNCFKFSGGYLSVDFFKECITLLSSSFSHQLILNNIKLTPEWLDEMNPEAPSLSGALATSSYIPGWNNTQIAYLHEVSTQSQAIVVHRDFNRRVVFANIQGHIEKKLLNLLYASRDWELLELENVQVSWQDRDCRLSDYFFRSFAEYVKKYVHHLKELSISGVSWVPSDLIPILAKNKKLIRLRCELSIRVSDSFNKFTQEICKHPCLRELDLTSTSLNKSAYLALAELLDKNYRIEKIMVKIPEDESLKPQYYALQQRLLLTPFERFKKEQLNQNTLLRLAEETIASDRIELLALLLRPSTEFAVITFDHADNADLPEVYRVHAELLENQEWLMQLDLHESIEKNPSKTVGYHLLEKAFMHQNAKIIKLLLQAGANLLQGPRGGTNSLLENLLSVNERSNWKQEIIHYLQQDGLSIFVSWIGHFFSSQQNFNAELRHLKSHFTRYFNLILQNNGWPFLLQLLVQVCQNLNKKEQNCKFGLNLLAEASSATGGKESIYNDLWALESFLAEFMSQLSNALQQRVVCPEQNHIAAHIGQNLIWRIRQYRDQFFEDKDSQISNLKLALQNEREGRKKEIIKLKMALQEQKTALECLHNQQIRVLEKKVEKYIIDIKKLENALGQQESGEHRQQALNYSFFGGVVRPLLGNIPPERSANLDNNNFKQFKH
jgi:hypothetical protein